MVFLGEGVTQLKIRLYDNKQFELPSFNTFKERVSYIVNNILVDDKSKNKYFVDLLSLVENNLATNEEIEKYLNIINYQKYYNICATDLSLKEIRDIEKWWLGVKKVNNPLPIENVKVTLDYLTGYILGSNDFSIKYFLSRYLELKKKLKKSNLTNREIKEFKDLKNKIIYEDKDTIFFDNIEMENQLNKTLLLSQEKTYKNYTDNFMINDINNRLNMCILCKNNINTYKNSINLLYNDKYLLNTTLKNEYKLFQDTKDKNCLDNILNLADKIKKINKDIKYNKFQIELEYDKYFLCTEFIYKTK